MGWWYKYWKENLSRSFYVFEKHKAVSVLIGMLVAAIPGVSFGFLANATLGYGVTIGFACWFGFLILFITPMKIWKEHTDTISCLTSERLVVSDGEIYDEGKRHWLRLKVVNPSALPIRDCYGKLIDRKIIRNMLTKVDGELVRSEISTEAGRKSSENMEFPPEGHRFPWSSIDRTSVTRNISGNECYEFLYLVIKKENIGCFWFATHEGNKYENWSLGDFEMQIEVGSDSDVCKPTKVRVVFRAEGGDLEFLSLDSLN